jgi:hypothetical protein
MYICRGNVIRLDRDYIKGWDESKVVEIGSRNVLTSENWLAIYRIVKMAIVIVQEGFGRRMSIKIPLPAPVIK